MRLLRDAYFISLSASHLAVDLLNSQKAIVLVFLAPSLGLTNSEIGAVVLIYAVSSSVTQPLFGLLADRFDAHWLSGGALLWMTSWFSVALLRPGRWSIVALIVGALGSAAFHSAGTERATARGDVLMTGRVATAASLFFLFGQVGTSIGPLVGGALLQVLGARGVLVLTLGAVPVAINALYRMYWRHRMKTGGQQSRIVKIPAQSESIQYLRWVLAAFAIMVLLRTIPQLTLITFLPKLFQDRGYSPAAYGLITSLFTFGGALGALSGGFLSDRWGRTSTIFWTLIAAVVPMYYCPLLLGPGLYPIVFLAGLFNGASHAVIVVLAQAILPSRRALASGLIMGFMFISGAFGSYLYGLAADMYPLAKVLQTNALLCLLAALLSLGFRRATVFGRAESVAII